MSDSPIPVDIANPGHVFACIGLMEIAEVLRDEAVTGRFDHHDGAFKFSLRVGGNDSCVDDAVSFLLSAATFKLRVHGSSLGDDDSGEWMNFSDRREYPVAPPKSRDGQDAVVRLEGRDSWLGRKIDISCWSDLPGQVPVRFWAGQQSGQRIVRNAQAAAKKILGCEPTKDPFGVSVTTTGTIRMDGRGGYDSRGSGFSLNDLRDVPGVDEVEMVEYPLVELLAAVGLTNARPMRGEKRNTFEYRVLIGEDLPLPIARAMPGTGKSLVPGVEVQSIRFEMVSIAQGVWRIQRIEPLTA